MVARQAPPASLISFGEDASSIFHGFRGVNSLGKWFPAALMFVDNWRVDLTAIEAFTGSWNTNFSRLTPLKFLSLIRHLQNGAVTQLKGRPLFWVMQSHSRDSGITSYIRYIAFIRELELCVQFLCFVSLQSAPFEWFLQWKIRFQSSSTRGCTSNRWLYLYLCLKSHQYSTPEMTKRTSCSWITGRPEFTVACPPSLGAARGDIRWSWRSTAQR